MGEGAVVSNPNLCADNIATMRCMVSLGATIIADGKVARELLILGDASIMNNGEIRVLPCDEEQPPNQRKTILKLIRGES